MEINYNGEMMTAKQETTTPADQETEKTATTSSPDTDKACENGSKETKAGFSVDELTESLQRLQAEFENFKKRNEKEKQAFMLFANRQLLMELLPVIDDFDRALQTTKDEGIKLIHQKLVELLKQYSVEEMVALGKYFDPKFHEALMQEESEKEPGTVLEVLQKGYILGDNVLRPAQVKVAKHNETQRIQRTGTGKVREGEHQ